MLQFSSFKVFRCVFFYPEIITAGIVVQETTL
jgi:hypothetical protein